MDATMFHCGLRFFTHAVASGAMCQLSKVAPLGKRGQKAFACEQLGSDTFWAGRRAIEAASSLVGGRHASSVSAMICALVWVQRVRLGKRVHRAFAYEGAELRPVEDAQAQPVALLCRVRS